MNLAPEVLSVVIASDFERVSGGVETWLKSFLRCAKDANIKVSIWSYAESYEDTVCVRIPLYRGWYHLPIWVLATSLFLIRNSRRLSNKVLILGTVPTALPFILCNFVLKRMLFVSVRGQIVQDARDLGKNFFLCLVLRGLELLALKFSNPVCNGKDTSEYVLATHGITCGYLPNAIRGDLLRAQRLTSLQSRPLRVLHLGTLRPIKGIQYIIDNVLYLNSLVPRLEEVLEVHFYGKGDFTQFFDCAVPLCIKRFPPTHEVSEVILKYDIGVQNSYGSGVSNTMLEFIFYDLPSLAPERNSYAYVLNERVGIFFDDRDQYGLANKMLKVIDGKYDFSVGEFEKIKAEYSWRNIFPRWRELLGI